MVVTLSTIQLIISITIIILLIYLMYKVGYYQGRLSQLIDETTIIKQKNNIL